MDKERLLQLGKALDDAGVDINLLDNKMFQTLVVQYVRNELSLEDVVRLSKKIQSFQSILRK